MIATTPLMNETNSAADNSYATLFLGYVNQSLAEALTTVRAVETKLADEERVQACHVLDYGLHATYSWTYTRDLTIALSTYMERGGHWEIWQQFLQRAIVAAQEQNDSNHEITLTALLARLYQRWSKPKLMVQTYRKVIRLARRNNNQYELARACSNLGYYFVYSGCWWRSELLSCYALMIFEALDSNHGRAHTNNHLGVLYLRMHQWTKAEQFLKRACILWQAIGDHHSLIYGFENLGVLYYEMNQGTLALSYFNQALQQVEFTGEQTEIAGVLLNIGLVHSLHNEFSQAENKIHEAERLFERDSNFLGLCEARGSLGHLYYQQGRWLEAEHYLQLALEGHRSLKNAYGELRILLYWVEYFLTRQYFTKANEHIIMLEQLLHKHTWFQSNADLVTKISNFKCQLQGNPTLI